MPSRDAQHVLIAFVVSACVVVTSLLVADMVRAHRQPVRPAGPAGTGATFTTGNESPSLFDQPLELRGFTLTDQTGRTFGSSDLRGRVWIASFVFTRCTTVCPRVIAQTAELQKTLRGTPGAGDVMLISFSVDPKHDTPAVLAETAKLWEAEESRWRFLTGEKDAVWSLIRSPDGFRDHVGDAPQGAAMNVAHSSRFVLVDREHRIRGYYDALDEEDRAELLRDVKRLIE